MHYLVPFIRFSFLKLVQKPGNLAHSKAYRRLLELVLSNYASRRIAGFLSSELFNP